MNQASERRLGCTIPLCIICYLGAIIDIDSERRRTIKSVRSKEFQEMLRKEGILSKEIEEMDKVMRRE
jgi:hypothetical protein